MLEIIKEVGWFSISYVDKCLYPLKTLVAIKGWPKHTYAYPSRGRETRGLRNRAMFVRFATIKDNISPVTTCFGNR